MGKSIVERARQTIADNRYLSMATCTNAGEVWIAPLAYAVDEEYSFYFYSATDSTHIEHIKRNPNVAFSIFNSTLSSDDVDGIQIAGVAGGVESADLPNIMEIYWQQLFPDPEEQAQWRLPYEHFLKNEFPVQRVFQIVPTEIYVPDWSVTNVDRRVEVKMKELRRQPAKLPTLAQVRGS